MSEDVRNFIEKNGITGLGLTENDRKIYDPDEINDIIANYGIYNKRVIREVPISQIIGYDYKWRSIPDDIIESLSFYFDRNGSGYQSRSVDLLNIHPTALIDELKNSFKFDPICVRESDVDKYTVSTNGLHRYTILKICYLIEKMKASTNEELSSQIEQKYTIPVTISSIDYIKTYSNYLLTTLGVVNGVKSEFDDRYRVTGNSVVYFKSGALKVMNNEELLEFLNLSITETKNLDGNQLIRLAYNCGKYPSFCDFIRGNVPYIDNIIFNKEGFIK